jgi:23S rRNA G2445 N2-methylase RlmL
VDPMCGEATLLVEAAKENMVSSFMSLKTVDLKCL